MSARHDIATLVRRLGRLGITAKRTNGGHIRWKLPNGAHVISASTPSDHRAMANLRASIRQRIRAAHQRGEMMHMLVASI
jgi:hypothetical protein